MHVLLDVGSLMKGSAASHTQSVNDDTRHRFKDKLALFGITASITYARILPVA